MGKQIRQIKLSNEEKAKLEKIANKRTGEQQMVLRSKIILLTAQGFSVEEIVRLYVKKSLTKNAPSI